MPRKFLRFSLILGGLLAVVAVSLLLLPGQTVEAQCGTQASSCKNCHEVQGELPVNNDGTGWHESHAFGDFCYVCHAGNQQATEKDAAHEGMVDPLSDIDASCKMCHAADLNDRAQVYAAVLGVDLGSGSGDSGTAAPTDAPSDEDFWGGGSSADTAPAQPTQASEPVAEQSVVSIPVSNALVVDDASLVDYTQRYNEIVLGERPVNWGNIALLVMIGLLIVGGGGFVVLNEIRVSTAHEVTRKVDGEYPADVVEMLPALTALKVQTRRALKRLLANPQKTDQVLGLIDTLVSDEKPEDKTS